MLFTITPISAFAASHSVQFVNINASGAEETDTAKMTGVGIKIGADGGEGIYTTVITKAFMDWYDNENGETYPYGGVADITANVGYGAPSSSVLINVNNDENLMNGATSKIVPVTGFGPTDQLLAWIYATSEGPDDAKTATVTLVDGKVPVQFAFKVANTAAFPTNLKYTGSALTAETTFTLTNIGTDELDDVAVSLDATGAGNFDLEKMTVTVPNTGAKTATVKVTLKATKVDAKTYTGKVTFTSAKSGQTIDQNLSVTVAKADTDTPNLEKQDATIAGNDGVITIKNYDNTRTYEISTNGTTFTDATVVAAGADGKITVNGTNAGTKYWVRVKENDNYKASAAANITVGAPKPLTEPQNGNFKVTDVIYNKAAQTPVVAAKDGVNGMGTITVTNVQPKNGAAGAVATTATNAGTYVVTFKVDAGANYAAKEGLTIDWTIGKLAINNAPTIDLTDANGDGAASIGETLTANFTGVNAAAADVDIQWLRAGANIAGATGTTYTVTADDMNKAITVKITAKADGNYTGSKTSAAITPGKAVLTGQLAVTGNTTVGEKLTAAEGTMGPAGVTMNDVTLQWYRGDDAIAGETGIEYTITKDDIGKNITVKATAKEDGTYSGTIGSNVTNIPAQKPDAPVVTVKAGNEKLTITWTKPAENGAEITKYTVTVKDKNGDVVGTAADVTADQPLEKVVTGLTNGDQYTVEVTATNNAGTSDAGTATGTPKKSSTGSIGGGSSSSGGKYYDVTYKVGKGGTISGSDSESVKANAYPTKAPKVTAKDGYEFKGWSLDGKTIVDPSDVRIKEDTTFTAIFESNKTADLNKDDHIAYVRGYEDGTFAPNKSITRAEAITIFARLMNEKMDVEASYNSSFSDVKAGAWYANYIGYMEDYNIINGYEDGTFRPDAAITRAEFAAMASRFDKLENTDKNAFTDVAASHWAINSINSAYAKGWIGGYPDGTFRPNQNISRAEVVSIVNNMLEREIDAASIAGAQYKTFPDVATNHWAYFDVIEAANEHDYTKDGNKETWK